MTSFSQLLAHATGGRRYCFVVMTYHENYAFFERVRSVVAEVTGFESIRADDIPGAGDELRPKIHAAIDNAVFVIGDVSQPRPNVYYEIGYAAARGKPLLLVAREDVQIPTDLLGVEIIRYADNRDGWERFAKGLRFHLGVHKDSHVSVLRAMIVPTNPDPTFILVNPKQRTAHSRFRYTPPERRTYGDYLGVVGILGAFASVYGERFWPEVLSASSVPEDVLDWDANLYLIGSDKANPQTPRLLNAMQRDRSPGWRFERCSGDEGEDDYGVQLLGNLPTGPFATRWDRGPVTPGSRLEDYGVIVRGPHPRYPQRMATILAGPHSLGTGAACLVATRSDLARQVAERLMGEVDLAYRDRTVWVLVKAVAGADLQLDPAGVSVVDAGVLSP